MLDKIVTLSFFKYDFSFSLSFLYTLINYLSFIYFLLNFIKSPYFSLSPYFSSLPYLLKSFHYTIYYTISAKNHTI